MLTKIKALLGLAQREDATTAELQPSLPAAEAELAAAQEAKRSADKAYRSALLTADKAGLQRLHTACLEAVVAIDQAEALVAALRERLAEAQAREAEVARVERYEAAKAKAAEGREALALYSQVAEDLLTILRVVAEGEAAVVEANADLPRGTERLVGVEHALRDIPAEPDQILSEDTAERWVEVGRTEPGTFAQGAVIETGPRRGVIRAQGLPVNEGRQVELRRFTVREFVPGTATRVARPLVEQVVLPGFLADEPAFAEPIQRPFQGALRPADVISHVRRLQAKREEVAALRGAPMPKPLAVTALVPVSKEPVRPLPAPPSHREIQARHRADGLADE